MGKRRGLPIPPSRNTGETTNSSQHSIPTSSLGVDDKTGEGSNANASSRGKRKWTSPCWKEYDCHDGSEFPDKKPMAYCKYCKGGPIIADSNHGTTNFIRHTETCHARAASNVSQMLIDKAGGIMRKKIDHSVYKDLVCLAIIKHGYPFTFAEHDANRAIHMYLNNDCRCISRNTSKKHCLEIHMREKAKLKDSFGKVTSKICLTSDMWSSIVDQGYLSLTAHYIDDEWTLHNEIIAFCHLPPPHNAGVVHDMILEILKDWGLLTKVFSITLDNAKYNDNMQDLLANSLSVYSPLLANGDYFHVRCGAHILNLIVQDGLKTILDATQKIRQLIRYVTGSKLRKAKFRECAVVVGVDYSKGLYYDCVTRWNSCYYMLERALIYRLVFPRMKRIDKDTPSLLTDEEWFNVEKIIALLKPFDEITRKFSGRSYPTANLYFKCVWRIECLLVNYCACEDDTIKVMAQKMKKKFDKYWENYSMVLSFAFILDPRYKLHLVKYCFEQLDPEHGELKANHVKDQLYKLFEEYTDNLSTSHQPGEGVSNSVIDEFSGFSFCPGGTSKSMSQLDLYLQEPKLDHTMDLNVLEWWKTNENRLPNVAHMARDILSIPITSVASESSFSLAGRVLTKYRASLNPETAEALVTTRSWLFGYDVEKDPNSLEDGLEYHLKQNVDAEADEDGTELD